MLLRTTRFLFLLALLCLALTALGFAGEPDQKETKKIKPKDLFKNNCKVCHEMDSPAEEYTPMSLIQEQWEEFFAETFPATHADLPWPADESNKLSEIITPEMLEKIEKFCVDHAADSEQPMTCG